MTFAPGTFTPAPQRSSAAAIVLAQGIIESKLLLRHGEQLLLNIIIPLVLLIGLATFPLLNSPNPLDEAMPVLLAVAATSSGFTSQAIALAFDRRYGGLKRIGASGVPSWGIIAGKIIAIVVAACGQLLILGLAAFFLGWRPGAGLGLAIIVFFLGVATFTAFGLLMGGTLSAEVVLAIANLIWLVLAGAVGWVLLSVGLAQAGWLNLVPSIAVASALDAAFRGEIPLYQLAIMIGWFAAATTAATKYFSFS